VRILVVDDEQPLLDALCAGIGAAGGVPLKFLPPDTDEWTTRLDEALAEDITLVAVDENLTKKVRGLFGAYVAERGAAHLLPVARYSRLLHSTSPGAPRLFELRLRGNESEYAASLVALARGFQEFEAALLATEDFADISGPGAVIAAVVREPDEEFQFAQYASRLGPLPDGVEKAISRNVDRRKSDDASGEQKKVAAYVAAHVFVNSVLRFPGPLLNEASLCAYFAVASAEAKTLDSLVEASRYSGPFDGLGPFYWRRKVDEWCAAQGVSVAGDIGTANRELAERFLGRKLQRFACERCQGVRGGFFCPFSERTVCDREECSVEADAWIPAGASMCRTERDFHDIWRPLVGP